jgi:hypothetical protein
MYNENKIKLLKSISGIAIGILLILVTGFNIPVIDSFADSYFDIAIKKACVGVFLAVGKVLDIEGEYHLPSKGWAEMIRHLELTFEAERPPPPRVVQQDLLIAAEESGEYF